MISCYDDKGGSWYKAWSSWVHSLSHTTLSILILSAHWAAQAPPSLFTLMSGLSMLRASLWSELCLLVSWRAGSVRGICDIWNKRSKIVWYIQSLRQDKTDWQPTAQPTDIQTFLLRVHFYEKGEGSETFNSSWISPPHWFYVTRWPGICRVKIKLRWSC